MTEFDWDATTRASNDVSIYLGRVADLASRWAPPPIDGGRHVLADPGTLLNEMQEAFSVLGKAISIAARTTWPTAKDYRNG